MSGRKPSSLSPLNRGLFGTRLVMMWERILPALFPYVLLVFIIAVAGQWGLFLHMSKPLHLALVAAGFVIALMASVRAILHFRMPTFTELNTRLAVDNGLKPERLIGMRHEVEQPSLRVGKPKAGIAESDPFALRYVALVAALLGFLILGPVSWVRIESGFVLFGDTVHFADMSLARK